MFERTLLLVTYDEHGGCDDTCRHRPACPAPGDPVSRGWLGSLLGVLLRKKAKAFDFTMLGPRVPAVVVSPHIPAGMVDAQPRDHASIPATLRALFAPGGPLTRRDEQAVPFHSLLRLQQPRRGSDLPDLSGHLPPVPASRATMLAAEAAPPGPEPPVPDYYRDFAALAELVARQLPAAEVPPDLGPPATAHQVTVEFTHHTDQARTRQG